MSWDFWPLNQDSASGQDSQLVKQDSASGQDSRSVNLDSWLVNVDSWSVNQDSPNESRLRIFCFRQTEFVKGRKAPCLGVVALILLCVCPAAPCWKGNGKDQTLPVPVSRSLCLA